MDHIGVTAFRLDDYNVVIPWYCPCWDDDYTCKNCLVVNALRSSEDVGSYSFGMKRPSDMSILKELVRIKVESYDYILYEDAVDAAIGHVYRHVKESETFNISMYRKDRAMRKKERLKNASQSSKEPLLDARESGRKYKAMWQSSFENLAELERLVEAYPWVFCGE